MRPVRNKRTEAPFQSEYSLSSDASALSPARLASVIVSKKTLENSIGLFLPSR